MHNTRLFDGRERRLLIILAVILMIAMVFMLVLLFANRDQPIPFTPPPFEENLTEVIPKDLPEETGYREFEIAEGFTVSLCGLIQAKDNRALVHFSSDADNTVWTRIVLLDNQGNLLGESGVLLPGQAVADIVLNAQPSENMDVTVKVLSYEPETYYSHGTAEISGKLIT